MRLTRFPGIPFALLAAVALSGCGDKPAPTAATPGGKPEVTVRLGHVAPMTGLQAHLGKDNENGALLAIDDLNAQHLEIGGARVTFELQSEDDQADPRQATIVAQKLVDAHVAGVIGHMNSGTTIPASKLYADAGIPQISGSATAVAYTRQGFRTAFRVMANDGQQGQALGDFAARHGVRSVAIVDDRTAYGQGIADEFRKAAEALGIKVVDAEYTTDKASDFKAILTNIKAKQPDLVFFGGMDTQGGPLVRQMRELGLAARFLGGDGVCTPQFMELGGPATDGAYCSLPGVPLEKLPQGPAFERKFKAKFNAGIQLYAPYVYDAVMVIADAMKRADSVDPAKYLDAIGRAGHDGVTARIEFDEHGDLKNGAISFYQFKGGRLDYLETLGAAPATAVQK